MNYLNNENVPSILRQHLKEGLITINEFNRLAETALDELEVLYAQDDEYEAECREREEKSFLEQSLGLENVVR